MGNRWGTGRMEAFSDGVFAIAITLLVLDIGVPPAEFSDLWRRHRQGMARPISRIATSFTTIGGLWLRPTMRWCGVSMILANPRVSRPQPPAPDGRLRSCRFRRSSSPSDPFDPDAERRGSHFYGGACLLVIQILMASDVDRGRPRSLAAPTGGERTWRSTHHVRADRHRALGYAGVIVLGFGAEGGGVRLPGDRCHGGDASARRPDPCARHERRLS